MERRTCEINRMSDSGPDGLGKRRSDHLLSDVLIDGYSLNLAPRLGYNNFSFPFPAAPMQLYDVFKNWSNVKGIQGDG